LDRRSDARLAAWLLAPSLAFVAVVGAFPVVSQLVLAFWRFNLKFAEERAFVGLRNFVSLARDAVFWRDLAQTAGFTVVSVSLELALGLAVALLLHGVRRGRTAVTASAILP
jgi:multiple sugar transport system permease protein